MLKLNTIYNEDCITGMKKIEDNSIDLIVTSPPYNINIPYADYQDNLNWKDYLKWCEQWLIECYRILKDDGKICINHYICFKDFNKKDDRFPLMDIRAIQEKIGFKVSKLVIWPDKTKSKLTAWGSWLSASSPYIQTPYEGILISYKKQWKKKHKGKSTISKQDFIEGVSGIWNLGTTHNKNIPAVFPLKLPLTCLHLLTYETDIVLDPFLGSGTTAIACKQTNRNYIGFEISKKYYKLAKEKLSEL